MTLGEKTNCDPGEEHPRKIIVIQVRKISVIQVRKLIVIQVRKLIVIQVKVSDSLKTT